MWESTTCNGSINPINFGKHLRSGFTKSDGYSYKNIVIRNKNPSPSMCPCSFTVIAYKWRGEDGVDLYNIGVRSNIYDAAPLMFINNTIDKVKIFNWVISDDVTFLVYKLVELFIRELGPKDCESAQICEGALRCICRENRETDKTDKTEKTRKLTG